MTHVVTVPAGTDLDEFLTKAIRKGMSTYAHDIKLATKDVIRDVSIGRDRAPVDDSGALADSLDVEERGAVEVAVVARAPYASEVHDGRASDILPFFEGGWDEGHLTDVGWWAYKNPDKLGLMKFRPFNPGILNTLRVWQVSNGGLLVGKGHPYFEVAMGGGEDHFEHSAPLAVHIIEAAKDSV